MCVPRPPNIPSSLPLLWGEKKKEKVRAIQRKKGHFFLHTSRFGIAIGSGSFPRLTVSAAILKRKKKKKKAVRSNKKANERRAVSFSVAGQRGTLCGALLAAHEQAAESAVTMSKVRE